MNNTFVFLASFFSAALCMWLIAVLPHKIDNWLRVRRRVEESLHPPKVRTTVTTTKAAINPTTNSPIRVISERPFVLETK